jgi:ribose transport system permease protein
VSTQNDFMPDLPTRLRKGLRFGNISAVYVLIVVIIVFSIWKSSDFPNYTTVAQVLNSNAVTGLVSLGLVIPLAAGVFDLSVGYTLGASSCLLADLLSHGMAAAPAIILALLLAVLIGVINGVIVVVMGIDSFIGTLASGSLLQAFILAVTGNLEIVNGVNRVQFLAFDTFIQLTIPVAGMFVVAAIIWYFLSHTAQGRFVYATGLGQEQARLAGIRTKRIQFCSLIVSASVAGLAGVMVTAVIGAGSPSVGPEYLIPAFAGVFLGATQFGDGLWNAWGTVIAIILLGTVQVGLALANVPEWVPYLVDGVVLIIALGLRRVQANQAVRRDRLRRRKNRETTAGGAGPAATVAQ